MKGTCKAALDLIFKPSASFCFRRALQRLGRPMQVKALLALKSCFHRSATFTELRVNTSHQSSAAYKKGPMFSIPTQKAGPKPTVRSGILPSKPLIYGTSHKIACGSLRCLLQRHVNNTPNTMRRGQQPHHGGAFGEGAILSGYGPVDLPRHPGCFCCS